MNTFIYYFSATGNSFAVARQIAGEIENTKIISIARIDPVEVDTKTADRIGFVFPVYAWGPPRMMAEFMEKVSLRKDQYVFAVATSGGTPGGALNQVKRILYRKGVTLSSGFVLNTGSYPLQDEARPVSLMRFLGRMKPAYNCGTSPEERLNTIVDAIKNRRVLKPEVNAKIANLFGSSLHRFAMTIFAKSSSIMCTNESCTGCRTCERICPRSNITFKDMKPVWGKNCEGCLACVQWCPVTAIDMGELTRGKIRGHNAEVKATDLMTQAVK